MDFIHKIFELVDNIGLLVCNGS